VLKGASLARAVKAKIAHKEASLLHINKTSSVSRFTFLRDALAAALSCQNYTVTPLLRNKKL
jgi:hypothetical protein